MLFTALPQLQGISAAWEPLSPHRATPPADTRVIGCWRWVMCWNSPERNLLVITKHQMTSSQIFADVHFFDCQARGINSHSGLILQSIIEAADVRIQNSAPQWWPCSRVCCCCCCCSRALLHPVVSRKNTFCFTGTFSSCLNALKLTLSCIWDLAGMLKTSVQTNQYDVEGGHWPAHSLVSFTHKHLQKKAVKGWRVGGYCAYRRQQLRSIGLFLFSLHFSLSEGGVIIMGCLRIWDDTKERAIPYLVALTHISGELSGTI